jgi:hypothetical protein
MAGLGEAANCTRLAGDAAAIRAEVIRWLCVADGWVLSLFRCINCRRLVA